MSEKELFGFKPDEVELIRKTVGKEAVNENELKRFLYRANKMGLNPLDGTIHLLTRNRKVDRDKWEKTNVIIVGIDGFRAVADRSGKLTGIKREAIYNDKSVLVRAVAEVYRKDWDHPAREVVPLNEYRQTKDGKPTGLWSTMPETMLKKCAEAAALRMAFPSELSGVYVQEEIQSEEEAPPTDSKGREKPDKAQSKASDKGAGKEPPKETGKPPKEEPPKEAPQNGETPKDASQEPSKNDGKAPQNGDKFSGELVILEPPQKLNNPTFGPYYEVKAFYAAAETTYTVIGKDFSALNPEDIIYVTGEVKGDRLRPVTLQRVAKGQETATPGGTTSGDKTPADPVPPGETVPGETVPGDASLADTVPGDATPGETAPVDPIPGDTVPGDAPVDIPGDAIVVKLTTAPVSGRKTFDGKLEDVLWCRAENDLEKYVIVARGTNKDILAKAVIGNTIAVKGEVVSETNGVFIYTTQITVQAEAVA